VNPEGILAINGKPLGTVSEIHKILSSAAVEAADPEKAGKWITVQREITDGQGNRIRVARPIFVKERSPLVTGSGIKRPEVITAVKGGPHPTMDVMADQSWGAMKQAIGGGQTANPSSTEDAGQANELLNRCKRETDPMAALDCALKACRLLHRACDKKEVNPDDIVRACNTMLDLAEKGDSQTEETLCREAEALIQRCNPKKEAA
jgi:hypothetical protein